MKILKNKTIIGILAILFGILICFILSPLYNKSLEEKTKVVLVERQIEKGSIITGSDLKVIEVGSYNIPKNIVKTKEDVIGKYALADLFKEDLVPIAKLSDFPPVENVYLEDLDGTNGAISITIPSLAAGLSNKLLSGDIVSIIATDVNEGVTEIPHELMYIKVLACSNESGKDIDEKLSREAGEDKVKAAATVTLLADDIQAQKLANLEKTKALHIKLVYRGEEEKCREFLSVQKSMLEQITNEVIKQEVNSDLDQITEEGERIE